jgi:hypothetical protein
VVLRQKSREAVDADFDKREAFYAKYVAVSPHGSITVAYTVLVCVSTDSHIQTVSAPLQYTLNTVITKDESYFI